MTRQDPPTEPDDDDMTCSPVSCFPTHHFLSLAAVVLDPQSWCGPAERLALALARQQISSQQVALELDHFQLHDDSHFSTTATSECCFFTSSCQQARRQRCGG